MMKAREMGYKSVAHLLMEELKLGKCKWWLCCIQELVDLNLL